MIDLGDPEALRERLLQIGAWYEQNKRALPWRAKRDAYRVWVAEIMLQQTRIEAVRDAYTRFLAQFPTVQALAQAEEGTLLKAWEGLGYYQRARNLHKAAQQIVSQYGGVFPQTAQALQKLPGIGAYTAGAIASIVFGEAVPAVDGNVLRVLMRLYACSDDVLQAGTKRACTEALAAVYPAGEMAGAVTEGLMELGELVCTPTAPRCALCPVCAHCQAYQSETVSQYPVRLSRKQRPVEEWTILLLCCQGRVAVRQRSAGGLLQGLWEFPGLEGHLDAAQLREALRTPPWGEAVQISGEVRACGAWRHLFTHRVWDLCLFYIPCETMPACFAWHTLEEIQRDLAIPSAFQPCLEALRDAQSQPYTRVCI